MNHANVHVSFSTCAFPVWDESTFSWNEESVVAYTTLRHPKNAVDYIVAAASQSDGSRSFRVPFIEPTQSLKILEIDDFLPMPMDAADEMMERWELVADVLEPEFLQERRAEYLQHLARKMPAYAYLYDED